MATLDDLSRNMDKLLVDLPVSVNTIKQDAAKTINFDLLQVTPVDTGQAMSNWIVQNGAASEDTRPAFVPTREGYMKQTDGDREWTHRADTEATRQANLSPAQEIANATIAEAQPGEPIHITNNLPYIQALDEGHSSQAVNFVDRAIILGTDRVNRAKIV